MLDRPCECRSAFPAIRVEGRCDDIVRLCSGAASQVTLLPLALTMVLEDEASVHQFQLVQVSPTALVLRLDPKITGSDAIGRCRDSLGHYLQGQGVPNVTLNVERSRLQRRPVNGKLRRVVAMGAGA
jgi:hypothetical protein